MLVVSSRMAGNCMSIIIPEDILPVLVPCVVRISDSPSLFAPSYDSEIEIFEDVYDYVFMAKDIPGNLTSFRGPVDFQLVARYDGMIIQHAQHDVEVVS